MIKEKESQTTSAVYLRIALNIAKRISNGEFPEGMKLYGRSIMASEYGVSPETVRRSMNLLADMGIVEIRQNSCAVVLSKEHAAQYAARFEQYDSVRALQDQLSAASSSHAELTKKIRDIVTELTSLSVRSSAVTPFTNYTYRLPLNSHAVGKSLEQLQFWQETGATVIAVKRAEHTFLSPGPYFCLEGGDTVVFIGEERTVYTVQNFLSPQ